MFSVPYNQDPKILNVYDKYKEYISEVYFSGDPNVIFAARKMDWDENKNKELEDLILFLNERHIESNMVLNSISDSRIFNENELSKIVNYLYDMHLKGLKNVTIANPILFKAIKENIPTINVCLSIISNIHSIEQLSQYYEYGLYEFCIPPDMSRDKDKILKIKELFPNLKIKMMANCFCRPDCIGFIHHHIEVGSGHHENDKTYFQYLCTQNEFNPMKKNIIFPGEISFYDYIDIFKISGRQKNTDAIEYILKKYIDEQTTEYDLIRLLDGPDLSKLYNTSYIEKFRDLDKISNCKYKCLENNCNYCDEILNKYFEQFNI